ncbi:MAG: 2-dehydro-3-deoxygluconokinase [Erythrobacter sp.]|nr:MAG: 2-dehydro-3-deoxygluconokinase [Erythrobacter sp.]
MAKNKGRHSLICFGECMIELARNPASGEWRMGFAGDTANVAIYAARGGVDVAYLSAVGDDPYSAEMRNFLTSERVDCTLVLTHPTRVPGLYAIRTDANGERSFTYWRDQSAVRELFTLPDAAHALANAAQARMLYLSGITLSLFDDEGRKQVTALASAVRETGAEVVFDGNYRARGWPNAAAAHAAFAQIAPYCSIVLPTFEDEAALYGDADPQDSIERWHDAGAQLVVVKMGGDGAVLSSASAPAKLIPCPTRKAARDTTGAGDSFNAAFLTALLAGAEPETAVLAGHRLAGAVVMHPGAIISAEAMPQ